jgi:hypothetical protein
MKVRTERHDLPIMLSLYTHVAKGALKLQREFHDAHNS